MPEGPAPAAEGPAPSDGDGIATITGQSFDQVVGASPQPYLVDFWAAWCAPCVAYEPIVAEIATEHVGRLRVGRVDMANDPELAERCGIRTVPALVLFQDGEITKRIFGARPKRYLVDELARILP
jgi:thioredoxin 1